MNLLPMVSNRGIHVAQIHQSWPGVRWFRTACISLALFGAGVVVAEGQLVSAVGGLPSASASGDSGNPIISLDKRYVLFSSPANNLVPPQSAGPVGGTKPRWLNVYLRDRLNGSNILVSAGVLGVGGNGNSWPVGISTNNQYVLFESSASNLCAGDTNSADDVFVRDMVNGTTTLVSFNTNGVSGNGTSQHAAMTPDGRYVAFVSAATDLVTEDTNGIQDVFIRDLQAGTTKLVSSGAVSTGNASLPSTSEMPAITPDGRYVVFYSTATNLMSGNGLAGEVYIRDLVQETTTWVSTNARSLFKSVYTTTNAISCSPTISDDGRWIGFLTCTGTLVSATGVILRYDNLTGNTSIVCSNAYVPTYVSLDDLNTLSQSPDGRFMAFVANNPSSSGNTLIYLNDALTETNLLVSADQTTGLAVTEFCDAPTVDATGRYVAFTCNPGTNLATAALLSGTGPHLYLRDMQIGTTQLIDADTNGVGVGIGATYALSADGSLVAFETAATSCVANDLNRDYDVVARTTDTAITELISAGSPSDLAPNGYSRLYSTSLSTNARFIAFASNSDNLAANDLNQKSDVFVRDTLLETNILISVGTNGISAADASFEPAINGNGRFVAYSSFATNIVRGDTNNAQDVFVYDLQNATNILVSAAINGGFGSSNSYSPQISLDGSYVLFRSQAQNLAAGVFGLGVENLFLRDLNLKTNYALTTSAAGSAAMTPDGHYIAFSGANSGSLYVWDTLAAKRITTNISASAFTNISISADGRWVAYVNGANLYAYDRIGQSNTLIATAALDYRAGLQFSADDRFLVFATKSKLVPADTNGTYDVYLFDLQVGTNLLVSQSFMTTNAANNASYSPSLSPDGRLVAYRSAASDLVPNSANSTADLYLYDRVSGMTLLITADRSGSSTANYFSQPPIISSDSKSLIFSSFASNLPGSSGNECNAIYALNLYPAATGPSPDDPAFIFKVNYTGLGVTGQNATGPVSIITWPASRGQFYHVQFKDNLSDTVWQNLNGSATQVGTQGQVYDLAPEPDQRFYRIVLDN